MLTYVQDFPCHVLTLPFHFSTLVHATFRSLSKTEHASERPDQLTESELNLRVSCLSKLYQ